ncbi:hypothetical protein HanRHA438_Chr14g0677711 [Helianthus annuus]|nr:hypothetical protein HanRHA438_Chr14g0677711 [Helianthus annuus]
MAQREGEYLFARRVADRGNDMSVFSSRARGEDRHPTRRVADRGSDRVYLDPRDLKIERLRQRVRDLEEIRRLRQRVRDLEEIRRLQQRVRDLELKWEMRVKETESGTIVRDDVNEEEEHPFCHSHPRFPEPFGQDCFSEERPRFDKDGIEPDEEECLFVRRALSGVTIQEGEPIEDNDVGAGQNPSEITNDESGMSSHDMISGFFVVEKNTNKLSDNSEGCSAGRPLILKIQMGVDLSKPTVMEEFQNKLDEVVEIPSGIYDMNIKKSNLMFTKNMEVNDKDALVDKSDHLQSGSTRVHQVCVMDNLLNYSNLNRGKDLHRDVGSVDESKRVGLYGLLRSIPWPIFKSSGCTLSRDYKVYKMGNRLMCMTSLKHQCEPLVTTQIQFGSRFNAPFDPGGAGPKSVKMTCEVEMFRLVMKIIIRKRVDVPFDPDGFGAKAKLEDEFFSKTGRMMQELISISYIFI